MTAIGTLGLDAMRWGSGAGADAGSGAGAGSGADCASGITDSTRVIVARLLGIVRNRMISAQI